MTDTRRSRNSSLRSKIVSHRSSFLSGLLLKASALVLQRHWARWNALTAKPREIQDRLLLNLLSRNRSTRFGRDHHFDQIRSLEDYRKQVQIGDYEGLRPYIDRAKNGEANALTDAPVLMFTMTSGSTGEPKLIPVTATTRHNHKELTRLWYYRAYLDHPGFLSAKLLGIVSPAVEGRTPGGIPFGAASGLIYQSSPRWIQNAYLVPHLVSEIKDFEAKYYVIMRLALEQEISFFGTPNPSTILRLVETADRCKEEIIKDIREGTITSRWHISNEIRDKLTSGLAKNIARARQLETFTSRHDKLRPREYWPGLQLIGCWKGGTVGIRLKELNHWFAEATPVRDLGYMASEAQISLPISDAGSAGILAIDKNFYEFIPESEIGSSNPLVFTANELEEGKYYYPILTTPAGLYRYDINDVIRVAGFYNQTPLIEFVRKGRDVTNITGEKLHVNQVMEAVEKAQNITGLAARHFRAFADVEKSRYIFLVEFDGSRPTEESLSRLLDEIDLQLHALNIEYAQKRESRRLAAPALWLMRPGWFERKAGASLQRGGRDVQFKAQLLSSVPEDSSEIVLCIEKAAQPTSVTKQA
jgi:GH3 auxin-responsive promoter